MGRLDDDFYRLFRWFLDGGTLIVRTPSEIVSQFIA